MVMTHTLSLIRPILLERVQHGFRLQRNKRGAFTSARPRSAGKRRHGPNAGVRPSDNESSTRLLHGT